jgi:uncharacterized RDD family membrane protein YckC
MSTDASPAGTIEDLPRAGFWRRLLSFLIDAIIVLVPFQVLAAILFAVTAGTVQMYGGLAFNYCDQVKTVPQSLDPPPPHDSNFAQVCRVTFFGATTGVLLTVARVTRSGSGTKAVRQGYMLNQKGDPIHGVSLDWIAGVVFLVYLLGMIWKRGRTLGDRIVGTKLVNTAPPDRPGIPITKTIARYLVMLIGFVPGIALLTYRWATTDGTADAMFDGGFFQWLLYAVLIEAAWCVLLIFQIALKIDPVYDRLAGTAVVKVDRTSEALS